MSKCQLCGEPMPPGEESFNYHGYSGPCPTAAPLAGMCNELNSEIDRSEMNKEALWRRIDALETMLREIIDADEDAVEEMRRLGIPTDIEGDGLRLSEKAKAVLAKPIT